MYTVKISFRCISFSLNSLYSLSISLIILSLAPSLRVDRSWTWDPDPSRPMADCDLRRAPATVASRRVPRRCRQRRSSREDNDPSTICHCCSDGRRVCRRSVPLSAAPGSPPPARSSTRIWHFRCSIPPSSCAAEETGRDSRCLKQDKSQVVRRIDRRTEVIVFLRSIPYLRKRRTEDIWAISDSCWWASSSANPFPCPSSPSTLSRPSRTSNRVSLTRERSRVCRSIRTTWGRLLCWLVAYFHRDASILHALEMPKKILCADDGAIYKYLWINRIGERVSLV